jgi:formylglycine-generating enzyme required for sulfatase activity
MHGNVLEWCADWYGRGYYQSSPRRDPTGPEGGTSRILRGGAWGLPGEDCRAARRFPVTPDIRDASFCYRVALTAAGL